jgi:hypothetical protein
MTPFHEHRDSSSSEVFWYLIASEVRMKTTLHQDAFLSFSSLPIPRPFRDLQTTDATTISISSTTFCPLQLRILQATHRSTAFYFPHPQAQHVAIERFLLLPYLLHSFSCHDATHRCGPCVFWHRGTEHQGPTVPPANLHDSCADTPTSHGNQGSQFLFLLTLLLLLLQLQLQSSRPPTTEKHRHIPLKTANWRNREFHCLSPCPTDSDWRATSVPAGMTPMFPQN